MKLFLQSPLRDAQPEKALVESFTTCQNLLEHQTNTKEMDSSMSGTTCTIVYQPIHEDSLVVAHVGDSRAVLGKKIGNKYEHFDLTVDHKPNLPEEKARIEKLAEGP